MIKRKDAGAQADADAFRARRNVRGGNKWRREKIAALIVSMKVTFAQPNRVKSGFIGVLNLIEQAPVTRGRGAGGVEADLHRTLPIVISGRGRRSRAGEPQPSPP